MSEDTLGVEGPVDQIDAGRVLAEPAKLPSADLNWVIDTAVVSPGE